MGYTATVTPKGSRSVDVLVYDPVRKRSVGIQVKAVRQECVHLGIEATRDAVDELLRERVVSPHVVVYFPEESWRSAEFYVVPAEGMRELAKREYLEWLESSTHRRPREELERTPQPLIVRVSRLRPYLERWENIWRP